MTISAPDVRVGARIRARRQARGLSLRVVAGLAGIDYSTLGRIERGENPANNRFILADIARALKCPVEYLTGVAVPAGRDGAETTAATHDTISALIAADLEFEPDGEPGTAADLAERVAAAIELRQACDYAALTRMLPPLVNDLYAATAGDDRGQALRMLARVSEAASFAVRYTGQPAGAHVAADRCRQAAREAGDRVLIAYGDWARAHAALGCGLHERAARIAVRAADDLADSALPGAPEMRGMLLLTHAFGLVGAGRPDDAADPLTEAGELAERTGETDTLSLMFGPTNVRLWKIAMLVDGGDPHEALTIAGVTNPLLIPSASRQAVFYIDQGRCLGVLGQTDRAVQAIETAERIAPQRVHGDPLTVETVRGLLDQAHRRAVGLRLRGLCERVGVAA
ncbi:MAG TPA: helix-turn-helix transcriptional regulator [Actinoplanes sp.]